MSRVELSVLLLLLILLLLLLSARFILFQWHSVCHNNSFLWIISNSGIAVPAPVPEAVNVSPALVVITPTPKATGKCLRGLLTWSEKNRFRICQNFN